MLSAEMSTLLKVVEKSSKGFDWMEEQLQRIISQRKSVSVSFFA
jgi:hypothetical protein